MTEASNPSSGPTDPQRRALVRRLVRDYLMPQRRRIVLALICMAVAGLCTAAMARLLQPLVDQVLGQEDERMLYLLSGAIMAVFILRGLGTYGQSVLMTDVGRRIIASLQTQMFGAVMRADVATVQQEGSGRLLSRFVYDVNQLYGTVTNALTGMGLQAVTVLGMIVVMFELDWRLASIVFVGFPIALVPIIILGRQMRRVSRTAQMEVGRLSAQLGQVFQGIRHVKAYTAETRETEAATVVIWRLAELQLRATRIRAAVNPVMELIGGVSIVAVMLYGGAQVIGGERTAGTFVAFVGAVLLAYQPAKKLASLNAVVQQGLAAAERVFSTIDAQPTIRDAADAGVLDTVKGHIRLEAVEFAYHEEAPALHGVTVEARAGETIALVGPSGAGKSTILNLIPRFYDVDGGRVTIDGVDVRSVTLESLRRQIALVSQEISLFDASVRDNIAYGRPDADDAAIQAAARAAAAHPFIEALPDGYDTIVGELGVKLSGGQRQRIAIARAMLKNAPILLLDEATSALDTESERLVQTALDRLRRGRTTVLIAHRLSTIANADRIYVLDLGRVVEQGSHAALLARNGLYARLWAMQTGGDPAAEPALRPVAGI